MKPTVCFIWPVCMQLGSARDNYDARKIIIIVYLLAMQSYHILFLPPLWKDYFKSALFSIKLQHPCYSIYSL